MIRLMDFASEYFRVRIRQTLIPSCSSTTYDCSATGAPNLPMESEVTITDP